jgi:hypothetical protein
MATEGGAGVGRCFQGSGPCSSRDDMLDDELLAIDIGRGVEGSLRPKPGGVLRGGATDDLGSDPGVDGLAGIGGSPLDGAGEGGPILVPTGDSDGGSALELTLPERERETMADAIGREAPVGATGEAAASLMT